MEMILFPLFPLIQYYNRNNKKGTFLPYYGKKVPFYNIILFGMLFEQSYKIPGTRCGSRDRH